MARNILTIAFCTLLVGAAAAFAEVKYISTIERSDTDYYPYVFFLSKGDYIAYETPTYEGIHGQFYRVAVANYEIYKAIYIENITYGLEGSNMKIRSIRRIDHDNFAEQFGYEQHMFIIFKFIEWTSPKSFKFQVHGDNFHASEIDRDKIKIGKLE